MQPVPLTLTFLVVILSYIASDLHQKEIKAACDGRYGSDCSTLETMLQAIANGTLTPRGGKSAKKTTKKNKSKTNKSDTKISKSKSSTTTIKKKPTSSKSSAKESSKLESKKQQVQKVKEKIAISDAVGLNGLERKASEEDAITGPIAEEEAAASVEEQNALGIIGPLTEEEVAAIEEGNFDEELMDDEQASFLGESITVTQEDEGLEDSFDRFGDDYDLVGIEDSRRVLRGANFQDEPVEDDMDEDDMEDEEDDADFEDGEDMDEEDMNDEFDENETENFDIMDVADVTEDMFSWTKDGEFPEREWFTSPFGVDQQVDGGPERDTTAHILDRVNEYMLNVVLLDDFYYDVRRSCQLKDPMCAFWAGVGECDNNPSFMNANCGPACETCDEMVKVTE